MEVLQGQGLLDRPPKTTVHVDGLEREHKALPLKGVLATGWDERGRRDGGCGGGWGGCAGCAGCDGRGGYDGCSGYDGCKALLLNIER